MKKSKSKNTHESVFANNSNFVISFLYSTLVMEGVQTILEPSSPPERKKNIVFAFVSFGREQPTVYIFIETVISFSTLHKLV